MLEGETNHSATCPLINARLQPCPRAPARSGIDQSSFLGAYALIEPFEPCRAPLCGGALGPLEGVPGAPGVGGKWPYSPAVLGGDCAATAAGV